MRKLLLSISLIATGFWAQSQVICAGVSPANIAGNYGFTWADPAGGDWACPDFLIPGVFVQDTLMLVEDGTPGLNPQGNPISQEGCNPLINDLTGKIAVIYRNTCEFGAKALNAQNAGAVGVIIINREDALVNMGGGVDGTSVTIPVVFISSISGATLVNEMQNGPVVMFLGNKVGAYSDDVGSNGGEMLISTYGAAHSSIFDGFDLGIQVYNFGTNTQNAVTVTANIDGPSGNVYNEVLNLPSMLSGDTVPIFNGNAYEFTPFNLGGVGNYPAGDYTLTYTIDMGGVDESDFDNVYVSNFTVNADVISLAQVDGSNMPIATTYPSSTTVVNEYQSCMMFQETNASAIGVQGVYFIGHADTSVNQYAGAEIFINAYQWDDAWVDLNDPNYTFDPTTNDAFQNLNLITFADYFPATDNEVDQVVYAPFQTPFLLQNGVRYLFCLQTFDPAAISFGYDQALDYSGNYSIYAQPVSPVLTDGMWYAGGWSGVSAPSLALNTFEAAELGMESTEMIAGSAYPNPAVDVVTVSVAGEGSAVYEVTDISGKVVSSGAIKLVNGSAKVDVSAFESGIYIFNVTLENGQSSTFNVVKK